MSRSNRSPTEWSASNRSPVGSSINFGEIPPEMLNEIALQLDFGDLVSLCRSNSEYLSFCTSTLTWNRLFQEAGFPIVQPRSTLSGWIEEYRRGKQASEKVKYVFS